LAAKPGQAATSAGGNQFKCAGTDPVWNVCTITATQLTQARGIDLQYPNTASVLVNVTGGAATLTNGQMTWNGQPLLGHAAAKQVILNFPGTGAISVSSFGLGGTFLAPRASVSHSNGAIDGAIVVNTLSSTGSYRCSAFSGTVR
jgi:choice-of-anchor A domain-containing protein